MFNKKLLIVLILILIIVGGTSCVLKKDKKQPKDFPKKDQPIEKTTQHFGVDGSNRNAAEKIADLGDGWSGMNAFRWYDVELNQPQAGSHSYDWGKSDGVVKEFQSVNRNLQINIRVFSDWALEYDEKVVVRYPGSGSKASAAMLRIKPEHISDWNAFIKAVIERYDADGYNDMPGLKYAVTHYQIESEPENVWSNADGFIEALCNANKAAKEANPNVQIMAAGFNVGDFFILDPETQKQALKTPYGQRKMKILEDFFKYSGISNCFDILSLHLSDDYKTIPPTIEEFEKRMRVNGYQKPIWSDDAMSAPMLSRESATDKEKKMLELLQKNNPTAVKWIRQEQSKFLVKKAVVAFSSGVEKIFLSTDVDWVDTFNPMWEYAGFLEHGGNPKPAFYTYQLTISKLDGFTKAEKSDGDIYKFYFSDKEPVYVLWSDSGNKTTNLSDYIPSQNAKITHIITEQGQTQPKTDTKSSNSILITETPVFVEETT